MSLKLLPEIALPVKQAKPKAPNQPKPIVESSELQAPIQQPQSPISKPQPVSLPPQPEQQSSQERLRIAMEQLRAERRKKAEEAKIEAEFNANAQANAQAAAEREQARQRYREEWERNKAAREKNAALAALQVNEERELEMDSLKRDNQRDLEELERTEPIPEVQQEKKVESDLLTEAETEAKLTQAEAQEVEGWLAIVNPTAADARTRLEASLAKAKKKLALYQKINSPKVPTVEEEIKSLEAQLASVVESENDLLLRLRQFTNLGSQALEFITDFMRSFFQTLRKKMDHVINFFYTVFVEMIPRMVASITSAVTDPIKRLLGSAWSGIKWAGQKIAAFGDGIVSAAKYLRELGGDLSAQTWNKLKEFYSSATNVGSRIKGLLFGSAKLVWITSKLGGNVALFSVNGVWKIVSSPTTMLVLSSVVNYINAIWNDPLWGKFVMEIFSYARNVVCEKVSNYFYDPRFQEVNAADKALEAINSVGSKVMDVAQFGIWKGTTDYLCEGGLKDTMLKAGEGFVKGLKENISAKSLLGSVPLLGGFGAILGGAVDSALGAVAEQSITAAAEAAEQAAIISKKKALLLEQWDFWIKFFTDDCVYPRLYTYNPTGWTRSTVDLLSFGWGSNIKKSNARPPLTQEHIDLEKKLVEMRTALGIMVRKNELMLNYIADFQSRSTNRLELPAEFQMFKDNIDELRKVQLQLLGAIQGQQLAIGKGEKQTELFMAEAIKLKQEEDAGKKQGKGLWNALGLPNSVKEAAQQVGLGEVQSSINNFIFTQAALEEKQSQEVEKYLADSRTLLEKIKETVAKKNSEIDKLQIDLEAKMAALRKRQSDKGSGSWNPFDWVVGSKDDTLDEAEKKAAEEIQRVNTLLSRLREDIERNTNSYLSVLTQLDQLGDKRSVSAEATAELNRQLELINPGAASSARTTAPIQ